MCKNKIIKYLTMTIVLILSTLMIPNCVKAESGEGFTSFNNAPRKYFTVSANKYADITMTIEDNNDISSVELYQVNSKGGSQKKVSFSSSDTQNSKKHIYTLSHKNMLKGKSKYYYIKIKDGTGNIFYSYFKVTAKTTKVNGKEVSYYVIDDGPRVINWKANKNNVTFEVKDNVGTKYVKVQDGNNSNKQIYKYENLKAGSVPVSIDMSKFKAVNGIYKVRIVAMDSGSNAQKSTRTVYFKVPGTTTNNNATTSTTKNNTSTTSKTSTTKKAAPKVTITKKKVTINGTKGYKYTFKYNIKGATKIKVRIQDVQSKLGKKEAKAINKEFDVTFLELHSIFFISISKSPLDFRLSIPDIIFFNSIQTLPRDFIISNLNYFITFLY